MKPSKFHYYAPATVGEAVLLLAEHGDDAKVLAGGQSLVPLMSLRLSSVGHLVDLNRIAGLDTIGRSNGHLRIGALVRQSAAEHSAIVVTEAPLVAKALPHIGHFQIRNRGTVGGSIAHADPASELPAVALALDAMLEATGPNGARRIASTDFFHGQWQTALAGDEMLTAIDFPVWGATADSRSKRSPGATATSPSAARCAACSSTVSASAGPPSACSASAAPPSGPPWPSRHCSQEEQALT